MEKSEKIALQAILVAFFIFGIKLIAAIITGSIALKAEAFHTLTDFIASLTVYAGLKIAKRKTKSFPYGLYKIENLISVVISLLVLFSGYEIALEAINAKQTEVKNSIVGIIILIVVVLISFVFSKYEKKVGKEINSPILIADADHGYIDVLSNIIVMVSIILGTIGYHLDKIATLIVVIFIAKTGLGILKDGVKVLLDASVDYETLSKTEKIILNTPQVVEIKKLTGRNSGRFKFIEANIVIKTHNLDKAHLIADKIENQIKQELCNIDHVLIHYEPMQKEEMIYVIPLTEEKNKISSHFGEAPWFMFVTFKTGERVAKQAEVMVNPFMNEEKGKGILAAEFLIKKGIDVVIVKKDFASKGPAYVFSDSNVEVVLTEEEIPEAAIGKLGLSYGIE
ncbi:MAG: cation diffusion facilitator family transporter [Anaerostipes sp.]|nr:cation diffusion facilitator family transporter [Anaerostipes sp.]